MLPEFETGSARHLGRANPRPSRSRFPADYHGKEVAGQDARSFEVTVKKVEEPKLPELDAEFARSLGVADGDLAKMRAEVKANVEREVKKRVDGELKQKVMQALLDSTQIELPKSLVEMEIAAPGAAGARRPGGARHEDGADARSIRRCSRSRRSGAWRSG